MLQNETFLAKQTYFKVIRTLGPISQHEQEEERTLILFSDHITSKHRQFYLSEINDLSFKKIGDSGGMLFLHSNHSVYPYLVKDSPLEFIEICKEQMSRAAK